MTAQSITPIRYHPSRADAAAIHRGYVRLARAILGECANCKYRDVCAKWDSMPCATPEVNTDAAH